jgi:hypothetical protein
MSDLGIRVHCLADKRRALIPLCAVLALCFALVEQAKGDFIGYYALTNFTLTNSFATNGSATTSDSGQSVVLTGGNSGKGSFGTTDLTILAAASGIVQFNFSYFSTDPSSSGTFPNGCGPGFTGPCDDAGYLLNGSFVSLQCAGLPCADDVHQGSGQVQFSVTSGEGFGFRVETMDNTGGPGVLTISGFSAPGTDPVPEPSATMFLLGLTGVIVAAQRRMARNKMEKERRQ